MKFYIILAFSIVLMLVLTVSMVYLNPKKEPLPISSSEQSDFMKNCLYHSHYASCESRWVEFLENSK